MKPKFSVIFLWIWHTVSPLWKPLPFVWLSLTLAARFTLGAHQLLLDASLLLVISIMAFEYGWRYMSYLAIQDRLRTAGTSVTQLYTCYLLVWLCILGLPCALIVSISYGTHIALPFLFFLITPLLILCCLLPYAKYVSLFHFLIILAPIEWPYLVLLQGAFAEPYSANIWIALMSGFLASSALIGLSSHTVSHISTKPQETKTYVFASFKERKH